MNNKDIMGKPRYYAQLIEFIQALKLDERDQNFLLQHIEGYAWSYCCAVINEELKPALIDEVTRMVKDL